MANTKSEVAKATLTSTTQDNTIVLTPKIQAKVKALRESRNLAKQAKALGDSARTDILDFVGDTLTNLVGVDAKGKRLISVKVIPTSESFDWERLEKTQPELYVLLKQEYTIPKGAGKATLRVDII